MNTYWKQPLAFMLALVLALSSFALPLAPAAAAAQVSIVPGTYAVDYQLLADDSMRESTAHSFMYVKESGRLIVEQDRVRFEHEIKNSNYQLFEYLGYRMDGSAKAQITGDAVNGYNIIGLDGYKTVEVRPSETNAENSIVTWELQDPFGKLDLLMHINSASISYNHWYHAQLVVNTTGLPTMETEEPGVPAEDALKELTARIAEAAALYADTVAGSELGEYPETERAAFEAAISQAKAVAEQPGSTAQVREALDSLTAAMETYKASVHSADKSALIALYNEAKAWHEAASAKVIGTAEGRASSPYSVATEGEYNMNALSGVMTQMTYAAALINNVKATDKQVESRLNTFRNVFARWKDAYYVETEAVPVYILDSLNTAEWSRHADDFRHQATYMELSNKAAYAIADTLRANVVFTTYPAPTEVVKSFADLEGGFTVEDLSYAYEKDQALYASKKSSAQEQVYQLHVANSGVKLDTAWVGLSYVRYKVGDDLREVYISYNASQLEALKARAGKLASRAASASAQPGKEQEHATAKAALLEAVAAAAETTANLAATRQQLNTAAAALQAAWDAFAAVVQPPTAYSVVHASEAAFSSMNDYLAKPADIVIQGSGEAKVTLTIKNSAVVTEFKVKQGDAYVDAEVISRNEADNTREVSFVADVSQLVAAKVRVVVPAQQYDREHEIRLNFNGVDNEQLSAAIADAKAGLRAIKIGDEPGQYSAAAAAAYSAVIAEANEEAARLDGSVERSAAALAKLQAAGDVFAAAVNKDATALRAALAAAKSAVAAAVEGTGAGQYKEGSKLQLQAAIAAAEAVAEQEAAQSELDAAAVELQKALITFQASKQWRTGSYTAQMVSFTEGLAEYVKPTVEITAGTEGYRIQLSPQSGVTLKALRRVEAARLASLTSGLQGATAFQLSDLNGEYELVMALERDGEAVEVVYPVQFAAIAAKNTVYYPSASAGVADVVAADSYYYVNFEVLKDGTDEPSMLQSYVVPRALVKESGGAMTVRFTLKEADLFAGLTIDGKEAAAVQHDRQANTSIVEAKLTDLSKPISAVASLKLAGVSDESEYTVQLQFRLDSKQAADGNASVPGVEADSGSTGSEAGAGQSEAPEASEGLRPVFADTAGHWAQPDIAKAVAMGIASGYADGSFRPNGAVTRAEFVVMLSRALLLDDEGEAAGFADASAIPAWAREHVGRAVAAGLISGYSDQTFRPDSEISRAELAVLIARAAGLDLVGLALPDFTDAEQLPSWAQAEIAAVAAAGLVQGKGGNRFDAQASATRAEALTIIIQLLALQGR